MCSKCHPIARLGAATPTQQSCLQSPRLHSHHPAEDHNIICEREPETATKSTSFEYVLTRHSLRSKARQRAQNSVPWCQNMSGSKRTKAHRRLTHERFMWHTFNQAVQSCTTVPLSLDKPKHLNRTATHTAMNKDTTKARPPNCQ